MQSASDTLSVPATLSAPSGQALEARGGHLERESPHKLAGGTTVQAVLAERSAPISGHKSAGKKWVVSPRWCTEVRRLWSVFSGDATVLVMETADMRERDDVSPVGSLDCAWLWALLG